MAVTRWHLLNKPVEFVTSQEGNNSSVKQSIQKFNGSLITGDKAKNIYETIINEPSVSRQNKPSVSKQNKPSVSKQNKPSVSKQNKPSVSRLHKNNISKTKKRTFSQRVEDHKKDIKTTIKPSTNFTASMLFKAAESGDLNTVKECVNHGININSKDAFSWTPLMMTAMNGNIEVVKFLLIKGADWENEYDGSGYDAYDLACMSGHNDIANLLVHRESFLKSHALESARELAEKFMKKEKVWCDVCRTEYTIDQGHMTSVLHRFSHRQQNGDLPTTSHFYITPSNRGYRMLRKRGWDGSSGLGHDLAGNKYPVKTVLRINRECLGSATSGQSRVTHFASFDESAVCNRNEKQRNKIDKAERKSKEKHLKEMEIDFRRQFQ